MVLAETRYAASGDIRIAYQVAGNGPVDLVLVPGFVSNLDLNRDDAGYSRLLRRLSAFSRVIQFDKRGTGLSDRVDPHHLPDLAARIDDIRAVIDVAGSGRAVVLGASEGAAIAIAFAAAHPSRVRALILFGGYAHFHTGVMSREALVDFIHEMEQAWGSGESLSRMAPSRGRDPRAFAWWSRFERLSASPTAAATLFRMNAQIDIRNSLESIQVPTLVLHRRDDEWAKFSAGRHLADRIAGARFVELRGRDHLIWTGDIDRTADEIEEFVTGARPALSHDRKLATIMVARLVAPEWLARRLGDDVWRERYDHFRRVTVEAMARFGGEAVAAGADDLCARFDAPARAIACALALRDAADAVGLKLAAGIHTGEVEVHDDGISGYALHLAEQISMYAAADEVLASGVVGDLVAGSSLHFIEHPTERMKGHDGRLRLFSVMTEQHLEPLARRSKIPNLDVLTGREREVLALVAHGLSNAAIAEQLDLSEHTAKRHVANILVKLDLPTRAAAAALVARQRAG